MNNQYQPTPEHFRRVVQVTLPLYLKRFDEIYQSVTDGNNYQVDEVAILWSMLSHMLHAYDLEPIKRKLESIGIMVPEIVPGNGEMLQ